MVEGAREALHAAVSAASPWSDEDEVDVPDAGVVVGWVLIAEWQGDDGNRWLSKMSSNAMGDKGLPSWHERGYCQEVVLHWPEDNS